MDSTGEPSQSPEHADSSGEKVAAQEAVIARARAARQRLKVLRSMSTFQYIGMQAAETLAFSVINAPPFMFTFFVWGMVRARFPAAVPGVPPAPIPQTFGGLLTEGMKRSLKSTFRASSWALGTVVLSALAREGGKVGPRHQDPDPKDPLAMYMGAPGLAINALAGAGMGYALLGSTMSSMPARRALYSFYAGVGGVALPILMAMTGPSTNTRLQAMLKNMGVNKSSDEMR